MPDKYLKNLGGDEGLIRLKPNEVTALTTDQEAAITNELQAFVDNRPDLLVAVGPDIVSADLLIRWEKRK
jgi:hypothetical protein